MYLSDYAQPDESVFSPVFLALALFVGIGGMLTAVAVLDGSSS